MRLDDDVRAAVERLRRERGIGMGEAVNELARAGMARGVAPVARFAQRTADIGLRVDVTNIGDVIEFLDEADAHTGLPDEAGQAGQTNVPGEAGRPGQATVPGRAGRP